MKTGIIVILLVILVNSNVMDKGIFLKLSLLS